MNWIYTFNQAAKACNLKESAFIDKVRAYESEQSLSEKGGRKNIIQNGLRVKM